MLRSVGIESEALRSARRQSTTAMLPGRQYERYCAIDRVPHGGLLKEATTEPGGCEVGSFVLAESGL